MQKLREVNAKLKKRLRDINNVVERTLEKKQRNEAKMMWAKNRKSVDPAHTKRVREQEIENSERQIGMYEAEIERIKAKIDTYQGVDGLIQKEEYLAELKDEIR